MVFLHQRNQVLAVMGYLQEGIKVLAASERNLPVSITNAPRAIFTSSDRTANMLEFNDKKAFMFQNGKIDRLITCQKVVEYMVCFAICTVSVVHLT